MRRTKKVAAGVFPRLWHASRLFRSPPELEVPPARQAKIRRKRRHLRFQANQQTWRPHQRPCQRESDSLHPIPKYFGVGKRRAEAFEPLIGHGIFTADGASWEKARKLVRPSFSRGQLDDISTFEPHLQNFLASLPAGAEAVDLQPLFQSLTLDVSTDFLFGESTNVLGSAKAASAGRSFADAFDNAQKTVVGAFALGPVGWLDPRSNFRQDQKTVEAFVSGYVDKALNRDTNDTLDKQDGKYSFAEEFAKLTDDRAMIRGGLLNLLLAGRDTSASLLSNLFFVLARRPDIYSKLAAEIRMTTKTTKHIPNLEDLKSMKYLRACINESLRLHPPIPRNSREALTDTTLPVGGGSDGGAPIFVPKGTQVGYQVFSMHRRKDVYGEDADEFIPERWTERNLRPGWAFLPFNGGPRVCIGQQFALNLASYIVCKLVQRIEKVESCDSRPWEEGLGITCSTKNGTWVRLYQHDE